MKLINAIKDKYHSRVEQDIQYQAENTITLTDFCGKIFFAYLGVPLIPVEGDWTEEKIMAELSAIRQNYINYKSK